MLQENAALLVGPKKAAQMLSISERTLWTLTAEGRIRSCKIGRLRRYNVDDLRDFARAEEIGDS